MKTADSQVLGGATKAKSFKVDFKPGAITVCIPAGRRESEAK